VHLNPSENESLQEGDTVLTLGRPTRGAAVANLFESRQLGGASIVAAHRRRAPSRLTASFRIFSSAKTRSARLHRRSDRRPILEMLMVTIDIRDVSVT
jgi:hypothetical protein